MRWANSGGNEKEHGELCALHAITRQREKDNRTLKTRLKLTKGYRLLK